MGKVDYSRETSLTHLRAVAQAQHDELLRVQARREAEAQRLGQLDGENRELVANVATLTTENAQLRDANAALLAQMSEMQAALNLQAKALYGKKTERKPRTKPPAAPARAPQTGHGPRENPDLATEEVTNELPAEQRACPACGSELRQMGLEGEVTEIIDVTVRAFVRKLHRCMKYYCSCNEAVVTAPGPLRIVPGGRYSPAFATEAAIAKYADHLPFERQAQIMRRDGLVIDSQTLWDQVNAQAELLTPTYRAILAAITAQPVIHADGTYSPVCLKVG